MNWGKSAARSLVLNPTEILWTNKKSFGSIGLDSGVLLDQKLTTESTDSLKLIELEEKIPQQVRF